MTNITYKSSGVDIDKANDFLRAIKRDVIGTHSAAVLRRKGAFGALYALAKGGCQDPVLVSSTDGVGTKLLIAQSLGRHDTVGIDLVAMNVNDILCVGAKPLFFLDYIACGKLKVNVLKDVVKGIAAGCRESGCSLVGGETAEMPGMYGEDEYDLAGFAVGVVEKAKIIDGSRIRAGDIVIGLPSSGLHSNGYSLARKALSKAWQKTYARELLKPTRIYVRDVLEIIKEVMPSGMAHMTGGAYFEKLTKILPKGLCFRITKGSWPVPKIFHIIQKQGKIQDLEMYRTFNMGIGLVMVFRPADARAAIKFCEHRNMKHYIIGDVIRDSKRTIVI